MLNKYANPNYPSILLPFVIYDIKWIADMNVSPYDVGNYFYTFYLKRPGTLKKEKKQLK